MAVDLRIKNGPFRQGVCRVKVFTRFEGLALSGLQAYVHLPAQDKHPLRSTGTVKLTFKTNRALSQLVARTGFEA